MASFVLLYPYWLIALLPLCVLCIWLYQRQNKTGLIAPHLANHLGLDREKSHKPLSIGLALSGGIAIIALSGPSFQKAEQPNFTLDSARIVVMDMSMSLYATDIQPNRLTQARYKALDLLPLWKEGTTGLIAYAGDAYTVSPLTTDSSTLHTLIPNLSPDIMPYQGANAASAVQLAIEMLTNAGNQQGDIILISDDIDDSEYQAIETLTSGKSWRLSFLAMGTEAGAPIQLADGSLLKRESGATVIAKSNLSNMQGLSQITSGVFAPFQHSSRDVELIANHIPTNQLSAKKQTNQQLNERVNNGYWLVPLLLIPALFLFRKGSIWSIALLLIPIGYSSSSQASPWRTSDQQAYQAFQDGDYQAAADVFSDQSWKGAAQYKAGDYQAAIDTLAASNNENDRYNLANAYAQAGQFEEAIKQYQDILKQNPIHESAKKNLAIVKQAQQQQQQQQDSEQGQDQSKSQDNQSSQQNQSQQNEPGDQQDSQKQQERAQQSQSQSQSQSQESKTPSKAEKQEKQEKQEKSNDESNPSDTQSRSNNGKQNQPSPSQQQKQDESKAPDQQQPQAVPSAEDGNAKSVDPDVRRLEQVESARDPSRLLRAQMLLQAQQKGTPQHNSKKW